MSRSVTPAVIRAALAAGCLWVLAVAPAEAQTVWNLGVGGSWNLAGNWNPAKMFAFLGTNNGAFVEFDGTYAGMTLRNLWVGSTPRPPSLGSAIALRR